jgi:cell division protein FtsB
MGSKKLHDPNLRATRGSGRGSGKYKKRRGIPIFGIVVLFVVVAITVPLIYHVAGNNAKLREQHAALEILLEEERQLLLENEQLERYLDEDNFDEYLERHARDIMGYANPLERVYRIN